MSIIQTCPECGADLEHYVFTTYPAINVWRCLKCGWEYRQRETISRIPFEPPKGNKTLSDLDAVTKQIVEDVIHWTPSPESSKESEMND